MCCYAADICLVHVRTSCFEKLFDFNLRFSLVGIAVEMSDTLEVSDILKAPF